MNALPLKALEPSFTCIQNIQRPIHVKEQHGRRVSVAQPTLNLCLCFDTGDYYNLIDGWDDTDIVRVTTYSQPYIALVPFSFEKVENLAVQPQGYIGKKDKGFSLHSKECHHC